MQITPLRLCILFGSFICILPMVNASIALVGGIFLALIFGGKNTENLSKPSNLLLKIAIVLMGFGMNITAAVSASSFNLVVTFLTVALTLLFGILIGCTLNLNKKTTLLVSVGTAICGGSAIAALAPVIKAKGEQISFALLVIFILNAIALLIFPLLGELFNLEQTTFGRWTAIAIHDTSSVVGAGSAYGELALETATTMKLTRALWIIPVTMFFSLFQQSDSKIKLPWFIALFVLTMLVAYLFPQGKAYYQVFSLMGKRGMVIALFLIGTSFRVQGIKETGVKPFILGIVLWLLIATSSFILLS